MIPADYSQLWVAVEVVKVLLEMYNVVETSDETVDEDDEDHNVDNVDDTVEERQRAH